MSKARDDTQQTACECILGFAHALDDSMMDRAKLRFDNRVVIVTGAGGSAYFLLFLLI